MLDAAQPYLLAEAAPPPVPTGGITPRPYQVEGIAAARRMIAEGLRRVLLVLATGGGKTVVAALVALGAMQKGKRVLFVGPRREIIAQAFWKLVEAGIPELSCGVVMGNGVIPHAITREPYSARRPMAPVQVASIQTLTNRRLPPADVVFVDEAHHSSSKTWSKVIDHYIAAGAVVVGLTATPCRADGKGLGKLFERLHVIAGFAELAEAGYLTTPRVYTTPQGPDLSKVRLTRSGEYDADELATVMRARALVGDVVEHWLRLAEGRTTVFFAASVEHSREVCEAFRAAGIAADHIDANTDPAERDAALARLSRGETKVLCNMGVCTEGWDEPSCKCVVLGRPTKSLSLYLQMAGRGLRPWRGVEAIILDHAGCAHEHGLPSDAREWSLDGRVKRAASVSVRTCPRCYLALPGGTPECDCGYVFPVEVREVSELRREDGELVEAASRTTATMDERCKTYEGMLGDSARRGRKVGYARHRYRELFGIWPAGGRLKALERVHYPAPPIEEPSPEPGDDALSPEPEAAPSLPAESDTAPLAEVTPRPLRARRIDLGALLAALPPEPTTLPMAMPPALPVALAAPEEVEQWSL